MSPEEKKNALLALVWHYGLAIGHVIGGAILFLIILAVSVNVGTFADWLYSGKTVDPFVREAVTWFKRVGVVIDGILLVVVGTKAVVAAWKS